MKKLLLIFLFGLLAGSFFPSVNTDKTLSTNNSSDDLVGVAILPDGALYEGDLEKGVLHGQGKMVWPDGSSYEGQFKDGYFHGVGRLEMINGDVYEGDFFEAKMTGQGDYQFANGDVYEGEVKNGLLEGDGKLKEVSGAHYSGAFQKDNFYGQGGYITATGDQYIGTFVDGSLTGQGEYIGRNGERYKGGFDYWNYDGNGRLVTADGDKYEGQFANGNYHGQGEIIYAKPLDGVRQVSGEWKNGTLLRSDDGSIVNDSEVLAETVLYNQNELLEQSWQTLQDNDPEKIDLYFLGIAGDGKQAVFRREVQFVSDYFAQKFLTQGKSMTLINDRSTVKEVPLATVTSIRQSLQELAARMDAENDILFVYMSSHGSRDFEFSLQQSGLSLGNLPAQTLADLLADVPIRWKVVVVSACYSGGFIPALVDENTLVITAAAKDRSSFGCSDRAEFTYFGEAFFKQALPISDSFVSAFEKAASILTIREFFKGYDSSQPQLRMGDEIKQQLALWRAQH